MRGDALLGGLLKNLRRTKDWRTIPALGGRARLDYRWTGSALQIRYGKGATIGTILPEHVSQVLQRRRRLQSLAKQASQYTDPNWPERFDRRKAPFVAAVIAAIE
ncbi:MAG: hypothetical protein JNG82_06210 [Opitutaceae bacterium]|nr:hypothetical protein [Opitutaceae bacterium]